LHQIIDDTEKFDLVTLHLEEDVVLAVEDLVIRRLNKSPESKLRRLLQGGRTSGLKPSDILSNMQRLETTRALCYGIGNHRHKLVSSIETFR